VDWLHLAQDRGQRGVLQKAGISWPPEWLLSSQGGLCPMELAYPDRWQGTNHHKHQVCTTSAPSVPSAAFY
jgi:hypothetical protein